MLVMVHFDIFQSNDVDVLRSIVANRSLLPSNLHPTGIHLPRSGHWTGARGDDDGSGCVKGEKSIEEGGHDVSWELSILIMDTRVTRLNCSATYFPSCSCKSEAFSWLARCARQLVALNAKWVLCMSNTLACCPRSPSLKERSPRTL